MAAGGAIVLIVVVAILVAIIRRRRRARALQAPLPLIPFSAGRGVPSPARPDGRMRPAPSFDRANAPTPAWSPAISEGAAADRGPSPYAPPDRPASPGRDGSAGVRPTTPPGAALGGTALPNDSVAGAAVEGASVRYWRPADGTLQFLPGRLEVIAGRDAGQEIRFVRTPGPDGTRVTFGRAEGVPYRHVQLREATVSRAHARMSLQLESTAVSADGRNGQSVARWHLENLSATNPVVVNGHPLAADESPGCSVVLDEGDRIEMGEVVFRFRER